MNATEDIWATRAQSLAFLKNSHPSRLDVLTRTFDLIDDCIDAFEAASDSGTYARVCGLTLLKVKHLSVGSYGLILDGLAQEAGALLRPMIEYSELLTYFRIFPEAANQAVNDSLPKAGERAKAIGGIYKDLRAHLNEHASHSSFSDHAISHLLEPSTYRFKKVQTMVPQVLEVNILNFVVQLQLMLQEGALALKPLDSEQYPDIAERVSRLNSRMFHVFKLNDD